MGRRPQLIRGVSLELHRELSVEIYALTMAVTDLRAAVRLAAGSAGQPSQAATKALQALRTLGDALLSDLLTEHGDTEAHRAIYTQRPPMPPLPPSQKRARGGENA
jgi:hypothetical protein